MLIVKVQKGKIEQAIKQMRRKVISTKVIQKVREKKEYTKKSVKRRNEINKAIYVQHKFIDLD